MLLSSNEDEVMHNLRTYVHAPQQRTKFLTTAVGKAYEGFLAPIKAGYLCVSVMRGFEPRLTLEKEYRERPPRFRGR
jgi:hypothetical protein